MVGFPPYRGGRLWGERHDVGFVEGILPCWERGEGRCCCEEEVAAEAVVGVYGG